MGGSKMAARNRGRLGPPSTTSMQYHYTGEQMASDAIIYGEAQHAISRSVSALLPSLCSPTNFPNHGGQIKACAAFLRNDFLIEMKSMLRTLTAKNNVPEKWPSTTSLACRTGQNDPGPSFVAELLQHYSAHTVHPSRGSSQPSRTWISR
jgi:hypothetical protein